MTLASKSLALLVVHPQVTTAEKENKTAAGIKSLILSIPYAVPESSSLKNALGKAPSTQKWIKPSKGAKAVGIHPAVGDILKTLENTLKEGHVEKAEETFFGWLETQAGHPENSVQVNGTGDHEVEGVEMSKRGRPKKRSGKVILNFPARERCLIDPLAPVGAIHQLPSYVCASGHRASTRPTKGPLLAQDHTLSHRAKPCPRLHAAWRHFAAPAKS
jgi:hypothetical protein